MVEPEIGSEALKIDVASPLTVQVLNISVCLYTIYICRLTPKNTLYSDNHRPFHIVIQAKKDLSLNFIDRTRE